MSAILGNEADSDASHIAPVSGDTKFIFPSLAVIYSKLEPVSYAVLRSAFGIILLTHGIPKLLGNAHGKMADPFGTTAMLVQSKLGLPFPILLAYCVTAIETVGALCLAAGLLTRVIAPIVAVEMAMICLVFWPTWAWLDRGMEYAFFMGLVALHIAMRGGGFYSIDRLLGREI
ncbi:putative oxidoreductase [Bradyrhizobium sp. GM22.5]